ncbi:DUF1080 domain-containing protein [Paenibacillus alginolyticus]|uniref:family 16 glycoside hydrolase n=1 Tax=Paenibacillus alginolyticus TaxID=59839 RepID=UPI0007E8CEC6|nr:family 16 glycoside hydrolase [Paenibacillus alginolyticus]MCY9663556.1 DUF1080 domain-containing protein [Paenibacillus alginolyticus]
MLRNQMFYWVKVIFVIILAIPILWTGNATRAAADGSEANSNLSGWTTSGDTGTLTNNADGMLLTSTGNYFALSSTTAEDFTYEADVTIHQFQGVGALVFRSNNSGWGSYMLQIDPGSGRIRLKDANNDRGLGVYNVSLAVNETYHVKVKAVGSTFQVYWGNNATPVISANDTVYSGGYLGLQVWNSSMMFQNIIMTPESSTPNTPTVNTNLSGWATSGDEGRSTSSADGMLLTSSGNFFAMSATAADNFTYEADVTIRQFQGEGALVFRSNNSGWGSYMLQIDPVSSQIRLKDADGDRELGAYSVSLAVYDTYHLKVNAAGSTLEVYWGNNAAPVIEASDTAYSNGYLGLQVWNSSMLFQNITVHDLSAVFPHVITNLSGWATSGDAGTVSNSTYGMLLTSGGNFFDLSTTTADNFTYESDVTIRQFQGVGTLVFRSNNSGWGSYMLQIDPGGSRIRLKDANGDRELGVYSVSLATNTTYHMKVKAVGSTLQVYWGNNATPVIESNDTVYSGGYLGLQVWNSSMLFQNIIVNDLNLTFPGVNSNLSGWQKRESGSVASDKEGMLLSSDVNVMALSETMSDDLNYETDLMLKSENAVGSLLFRSDDSGRDGYLVQLDLKAQKIRLLDTNDQHSNRLWIEKNVTLAANQIYHLRVKAEKSHIQVYFAGKYDPLIVADDGTYSSGRLGLHVFNGSVQFQNIMTGDLTSNLKGWTSRGEWSPNLNGVKGVGPANAEATRLADSVASDFVFEGDVTVDSSTPQAVAGLMFRSDREGMNGYMLRIHPSDHTVTLLKKHGDAETEIQSVSGIPIPAGNKHHIEITAEGSNLTVYVDGYSAETIAANDADFSSGYAGMTLTNGIAYFQNVYLTPYSNYYDETYRPQYHYSPERGSVSDPNGLVYFEGEYHLFHQDGGQWAHAISTDLVHWKQMPIALSWNKLGHIWSGSAVADVTNASGLFGDSGGKGLIAYYTSYNPDKRGGNQKIGLAYSKDKGRTWEYYGDDAVVPNPGGINGDWDFRDPKVVRDDVNNRWIMVVSGGDHIEFFTSTDLLHWTWSDNFGYGPYLRGGVWECPDLFQLAVDGNANNKKWVLMISTGGNPNTQGSSAEYFIGQVTAEGKFVNDNPAGKVLLTDIGKDNYASTSFYNAPDNRRIMLAWMSNWDYPFSFPTNGWKGQMTMPRELSLKTVNGNVILAQNPISELSSLRGTDFSVNNVSVKPQSGNILGAVKGTAYEINAEIQLPDSGAATEFGFRLREGGEQKTVVGYRSTDNMMFVDRSASGRTDFTTNFTTLHEAVVQPVNGVVHMQIFVDESSLEVFGNDGAVVFSDIILPNSSRSGMSFYASGGTVVVKALHVYSLKNTSRSSILDGNTVQGIVLDQRLLELGVGDEQRVYADAEPYTALDKSLMWETSNPNVVQVQGADNTSARLRAVSLGTATITVKTANGAVRRSMDVSVGSFSTNLSGWNAHPASEWLPTLDGIRGSFDTDSNNMSTNQATDFTYEADLMLSKNGGAGSILFRASADGTNGYYFNVDPNLHVLRLFYKAGGQFDDRQILAKVPKFIQKGLNYHAKIVASGPHIQIYFDNQLVIDITDYTYRQGYFGLNVFGGKAYYQNVNVTNTTPIDLNGYHFVNRNSGQVLGVDNQNNSARVKVQLPDNKSINQNWTYYKISDDAYTIRSASSDKSLDWDMGQNDVQLYPFLNFDNQRWLMIEHEDGTVTIVSKRDPSKALEAEADGAVQLADRNDHDKQKWKIVLVEKPIKSDDTPPPSSPSVSNQDGPVKGASVITQPSFGSGGVLNAEVKTEDLQNAINNAAATGNETVTIEIPANNSALSVNVAFHTDVLKEAHDKGIDRIAVKSQFGTVAIIPDALGTNSGTINLTITRVDQTNLDAKQQEKIGNRPVFDFNISVNGTPISKFGSKKSMMITMPYTITPGENPNTIVVYYLGDNGKLEVIKNGNYDAATGGITFFTNHFSKYTIAEVKVTFTDLGSAEWARAAIESLSAKQVINGYSVEQFNPQGIVTRAEFLKMLLGALDLVDASAEIRFKDVQADQWYAGSIATAQKLGIVSGYQDGTFRPDQTITREEMSFMVSKASKLAQVPLAAVAAKVIFKDDVVISGFAAEAVSELQQSGVINGFEDGTFKPKNTASRAEAAQIINKVLLK